MRREVPFPASSRLARYVQTERIVIIMRRWRLRARKRYLELVNPIVTHRPFPRTTSELGLVKRFVNSALADRVYRVTPL